MGHFWGVGGKVGIEVSGTILIVNRACEDLLSKGSLNRSYGGIKVQTI